MIWGVVENDLTAEVAIKEVKEDEKLPLKKKYVPLFYKVCNYMIDYSYGRHTYMPSTCRNFVKANMKIMSLRERLMTRLCCVETASTIFSTICPTID